MYLIEMVNRITQIEMTTIFQPRIIKLMVYDDFLYVFMDDATMISKVSVLSTEI